MTSSNFVHYSSRVQKNFFDSVLFFLYAVIAHAANRPQFAQHGVRHEWLLHGSSMNVSCGSSSDRP